MHTIIYTNSAGKQYIINMAEILMIVHKPDEENHFTIYWRDGTQSSMNGDFLKIAQIYNNMYGTYTVHE